MLIASITQCVGECQHLFPTVEVVGAGTVKTNEGIAISLCKSEIARQQVKYCNTCCVSLCT